MSDPKPGDWVQVWGQVAAEQEGGRGVHPEDLMVTLFSHSEQFTADVRKDRVTKPDVLPGFVETCTALYEVTVRLGRLEPGDADPMEDHYALLRCTKHERHRGKHKHRGWTWNDHLTYGYVEENT